MEIAITKMSSKGQIVIPIEMRENIPEGEKVVIIKSKDQIIMKLVKDFEKTLEEDLIFAKRTEDAIKRYEKGTFNKMSKDKFLGELKKW